MSTKAKSAEHLRANDRRNKALSPIEALIDLADLRCTICDAPKSVGCDCWTKCHCGWSFQAGTECRNPKCDAQ
jgi:hypothetical protein